MTVTYTQELHTAGWFNFFRLLLRWRGSFYKLIMPQCIVFFAIYFSLLLCYTFLLDEQQRRHFEDLIAMFARNKGQLGAAVAFFLGFFINLVFNRFWNQFLKIPWPDGFAFLCSVHIVGTDKRSRVMRRTLVRYICAATVMGLCKVAPKIKKRFPNFKSYTCCDLLTENEANMIEEFNTDFSKHYLPLTWACSLIRRARKEGRIQDEYGYTDLITEIDKIRGQLGMLSTYEWITVPLVYIHVVVLAVYCFFAVTVLTHPFEKWMFTSGHVFSVNDSDEFAEELDRGTRMRMRYLFAIITLLQFSVYAGMLHTSEALLVPFGYNDNDIDIDQLVDRHLRVGYCIVDEMYAVIPELTTDNYWTVTHDQIDLPYTAGATNRQLSRTASFKPANLNNSDSSANKRSSKLLSMSKARSPVTEKPPTIEFK